MAVHEVYDTDGNLISREEIPDDPTPEARLDALEPTVDDLVIAVLGG